MVKGLKLELLEPPVQHYIPDSASNSPQKDEILRLEIQKLLAQNIVEPAFPSSRAFVSHLFLRDKADGSHRPILNLSHLNEYTPYRHFKMDHINVVMSQLPQGCFMTSVDITQAYHSLGVAMWDRDWLQFQFHGERLRFTCMPNGLSPGPRIFTRLMKVLFSTVEPTEGVSMTFYIDDTLVYGLNAAAVIAHTLKVIARLQQAGFTVNFKKSILIPAQTIEYLGFKIDSVTLTLTVPAKKQNSLLELIGHYLHRKQATIRHFSSLVGKLIATAPGNDRAKVLCKVLQQALIRAVIRRNMDFSASLNLTHKMKRCLQEWASHIPQAVCEYTEKEVQMTLFTDSSLTGWGFFWEDGKVEYGESWCEDMANEHINVLELEAIRLTLLHLQDNCLGKHLHLFVDNTTAIACLRRGGSTSSYDCNDTTEAIYRLCWKEGITFMVTYCPSKENVHADRASRAFETSAEWGLDTITLHLLDTTFGFTDIDLFASPCNAVCDKFVTLVYDYRAYKVDAWSFSWKNMNTHIFPPFHLVGRVLRKILTDRPRGRLIVPEWKSQPWYPMLTKLSKYHLLIKIPVTAQTLQWPDNPSKKFPLAGQCNLLAIPL